jgi:hypothetical protein
MQKIDHRGTETQRHREIHHLATDQCVGWWGWNTFRLEGIAPCPVSFDSPAMRAGGSG